MEKSLFKKIRSQYYCFSSFAIWNPKDINDTEVIRKNISKLHSKFVFIGLNASASVREFGNFHHIHTGGRDAWLAESLGKDKIFCGAYMTDIIKNDKSPRQRDVDISPANVAKNIKILRKEIDLVGAKNSILIAFGRTAHDLLLKEKLKVEYLVHYASWIKKEKFLSEVRRLQKSLKTENR